MPSSEPLCDLCKKNVASAHIARVVLGETIQQHLCEACAGRQYKTVSSEEEKNSETKSKPASGPDLSSTHPVSKNRPKAATEPLIDSERCPQCNTTWDRLQENGRAGCAHCYVTFEDQVFEVVTKLQFSPQHVGKTPQSALRRRRRLEDLRTKQIHRLEMLQRRLEEAVATENYEEAAAVRDKLHEIEITLISPEN